MGSPKVVQAANDIHTGIQCFGLANEGAGSARQAVETLAESSIETFNISPLLSLLYEIRERISKNCLRIGRVLAGSVKGNQRGKGFERIRMQSAKELARELSLGQTVAVRKVLISRDILDLVE